MIDLDVFFGGISVEKASERGQLVKGLLAHMGAQELRIPVMSKPPVFSGGGPLPWGEIASSAPSVHVLSWSWGDVITPNIAFDASAEADKLRTPASDIFGADVSVAVVEDEDETWIEVGFRSSGVETDVARTKALRAVFAEVVSSDAQLDVGLRYRAE